MQSRAMALMALAAGVLLLVPLVAMQFTDEVDWGVGDFVMAGSLLFGGGVAHHLLAGNDRSMAHRAAVGVAIAATVLLVWVNLAVGLL